MKTLRNRTRYRWVLISLMAVLLGAQVAQAAHQHADHGLASECLQCQLNAPQALAVTDAATPRCLPAPGTFHPDLATTPVATFYRLAARGPPALSS